MFKTRRARAIGWFSFYSVIVLLPLLSMILFPLDEPEEWIREFAIAVGFAGVAMLGLQLILTARFPFLDEPFGADIIYRFHHQISIATLGMMLLHPILIFGKDVYKFFFLLNFFDVSLKTKAAEISILAAVVLVVISVWRKKLRITNYVAWRIWHGSLGIVAYVAVMIHILLVNNYMAQAPIRWLILIYAGITLAVLIYTRIVRPIQLHRNPWEVVSVEQERGSAYSLNLSPLGKGIRFEPGQYAWITAWRGPFANAQHPFSFSSSAEDSDVISFGIKELGDFTATIKELKPGDKIYVEGPYGGFSPDRWPDATSLILVPGGIGVSPMMSILRTMADRGDKRPIVLLYGNYDSATAAYYEEILDLKEKLNLTVRYVLEAPQEGEDSEKGYITQQVLERYLPPEDARDGCHVFICGPGIMMNFVEASCLNLGLPISQIHSERFDLV